jgi:hypothetical protein
MISGRSHSEGLLLGLLLVEELPLRNAAWGWFSYLSIAEFLGLCGIA